MDNAKAIILVENVPPGFGFCFLVRLYARRLGVRGFVQYLPSGDAEVVAEGGRSDILELYEKIRTFPPGLSRKGIILEWGVFSDEYATFDVMYCALAGRLFYD